MIKIQIPENGVGIRVFTEEVPDLKELPEDVETILIGILLHCTLQYLQEHSKRIIQAKQMKGGETI